MNKKLIRLTEQDLHRIVKESVERILNEEMEEGKIGNFFNNFRRSVPVSDIARSIPTNGDGQRYIYNSKTGNYEYIDDQGERHDTGVKHGEGRVGMNWNPFKSTTGHQVSKGDASKAKQQLRQWNATNPEKIRTGKAWLDRKLKQIDRETQEHRDNLERLKTMWAKQDALEDERRRYGDPERGYYAR